MEPVKMRLHYIYVTGFQQACQVLCLGPEQNGTAFQMLLIILNMPKTIGPLVTHSTLANAIIDLNSITFGQYFSSFWAIWFSRPPLSRGCADFTVVPSVGLVSNVCAVIFHSSPESVSSTFLFWIEKKAETEVQYKTS